MEINSNAKTQCHVCQHLGERECKYTSHKKYLNQKGNESFRVGNLSWTPSQIKPQSSYLKSLKENQIQFEFPSQIPVPNKSIQKIKNLNDQSTKKFQRTLIEKVIENLSPQKPDFYEKNKQIKITNYQTNSKQLNLKQFEGYSISIGVIEQQKKSQIKSNTKRPANFLRYRPQYYKKAQEQQTKILRLKVTTQQIGSALKQQKSPIHQTNNLSPIQVRQSKYHFQYGKNGFISMTGTKQYDNKKLTQNSFMVDDQKITNQAGDMLISRVNQKERSSFYRQNILNDFSTIKENKKREESPLKPVLSEFNQESESLSIIQNLQYLKTNPHSPRPQIKTERPSLSINDELRVKFEYPIRQDRKLKNSNVSPYDFSKHSISTAQQQNPNSVYIPSSYTHTYQNQAKSRVVNQHGSFYVSSPPRRHQIVLYPIYPVYEIVYELVSVSQNKANSRFSNTGQRISNMNPGLIINQ